MAATVGETPPDRAHPFLLPALLIVGATAGFVIGGVFGGHWADPSWGFFVGLVRLVGQIFMNILKMLVVPLIVASMIAGMAAMGDAKRVGNLFGFTFGYYVLTTLAATGVGLFLVNVIAPGVGAGTAGAAVPAITAQQVQWYDAIFNLFREMFPPNIVKAAAETQVLGLIIFSITFGYILTTMGAKGRPVLEFFDSLNEALLKLVRLVVWLAPIGVMGLVADRVGKAGGGAVVWTELRHVAWYFVTVVLGLIVHGALVLPAILFFATKRSPLTHARHFLDALLMAFSTASSAATLPLTIECARDNAKISPKASGFVLPLGATINMDGTALYEAVAVIFIAQAYGIDLTLGQMLIVMFTATLAAIGAAAIPEAGLVTMVMVLTAVNVPVEGIGVILSVDWLLDRFRTTVNVWGDTIGAAVVERHAQSGL
ncbi:MAG: dicarboxylate/amino acid:cation symporter [Deltaproteobacteria bacterium]|nr:dicarboxylate/amino acid:cation symporter [Deltaproteobacteria bacterium]